MARIPGNEIERLKREAALERLGFVFGLELKRPGAEPLGRCPFPDDKTPSLVVSPKKTLSVRQTGRIGGWDSVFAEAV